MYYEPSDPFQTAAGCAIAIFLFALMISVLIFLIVLFLVMSLLGVVLAIILKRWVIPQLQKPFTLQPRLFGAPPMTRWQMAYEYWMFQLEQITGIPFNASPLGLTVGALIISLTPALVFGGGLMVLYPSMSSTIPTVLTVGGIILGLLAGNKLGQPGDGWFRLRGGAGETPGGITLGEQDW